MQAKRRFNWINGFVTAWLNAIICECTSGVRSDLTFRRLYETFMARLQERAALYDELSIASESFVKAHVRYLFHLESEMWGADYEQYLKFFQSPDGFCGVLQTFLLPHSFFLIERWLELLVRRGESEGCGSFRRKLFCKEGLFSEKYPYMPEIMGFPYCFAWKSPQNIIGKSRLEVHRRNEVPATLKDFYSATTRKEHYCEIIEAAFKRTKPKLSNHLFRRRGDDRRKRARRLTVYFYDVWWIYSESMRYKSINIAKQCLENPFHWNRSIRWVTSLTISALLWFLSQNPNARATLESAWKDSQNKSQILKDVFGESRDRYFLPLNT